jgi:hypothetical protein
MNTALNAAIYSTIGGTATSAGSAVYFLNAPDAAALPYIVFDYTADITENMTPNETENAVIFARAYATTPGAAGTIDAQIKTKLHLKVLTVTGWTNFWTARENAFSLQETDAAGKHTYMAGAEYRIRIDKD